MGVPGGDVGAVGGGDLRFGVLGPLEVTDGVRSLVPPRRKPRALLAGLVLRAGQRVTVEALIDALWGPSPPASARNLVQGYVSEVRRHLGDRAGRVLRTVDAGYLLDVPDGHVDARRFEQLLAAARSCLDRDPERAAALLREAEELWRGPVLADLASEELAAAAARRLEELRRTATELRVEADLARGRHREAIAELQDLVAADPLRESAWGLLAVACYRAGRQADALDAVAQARRVLRKELGVDPGPQLTEVERRILTQDPALEPDAPPPPTGNLPAPVVPLVGREAELRQLERLLGERRLVTLTGPGGCGKTRLAVEVAHRLADRFPDGVWFTDLGPASAPAAVAERVAAVLGLRAEPDRTLAETFAAYLAPRRALVVLDSCDQVVAATAELVGTLLGRGHATRVLATSQAALRAAGEAILPLAGLPVPAEGATREEVARADAARLFAERAAAVRPGFGIDGDNAAPVTTICRTLDGLPLALELAAARMRSLTPAQIAERLSDRFALLTRGPRTAPPRHRTLHAAIDWSYRLLSTDEQDVLHGLAVLPAPFCVRAVSAVIAEPPRDRVLDLLDALVERSLVAREDDGRCGARFRLLDSVQAFAAGRLAEHGGTAPVRARHARFAAELAEEARLPVVSSRAHHDTGWSLDKLDEHRVHLTGALAWCLDGGDARSAARILHHAWWLWFVRGPLAEISGSLRRAVDDHAGEAGTLLPGVLLGTGWVTASEGRFADVAGVSRRCIEVARAQRDLQHVAAGTALLATASWATGAYPEAEAQFRDSIAMFREAGHTWFEASERVLLARVVRDLGRDDEADALLARGLDMARDLAEPFLLGVALDVDAAAAHARGDHDRTRRSCEEALTHYRRVGYQEGIASVLTTLGRVALDQGEAAAADQAFREGLLLARRLGHPGGMASCLTGLAHVAAQGDRPDRAALLLAVAERVLIRIGAVASTADAAAARRLRARLRDRLRRAEMARLESLGGWCDLDALIQEVGGEPSGGTAARASAPR